MAPARHITITVEQPSERDTSMPGGARPGRSVLAGLVGRGIQRSRTPAMHEAEGARLGLRYVYRLFDLELMETSTLPEILRAAELCGFAGLNITHPFKKQVMEHLDTLSDAARTVDAVNTVVFRDGARVGHNTDMWGFAESFRLGMRGVDGSRVLLIGAGGAGGAVAHALLDCGIERLFIHDKDPASAQRLGERLTARFGRRRATVTGDLTSVVTHIEGVVNATPVGTANLPGSPFPVELLAPRLWVADVVYFPIETELLRAARETGCRVLSGSGMAIFQAVRAFELFAEVRPDSGQMKAAFDAFAV